MDFKRTLFIFLVIFVIFIVNIIFVSSRTSTGQPEGAYPSSEVCDTTFGGVEICDYCYDCGADDDVCPLFIIEKILNYSIESYQIKEHPTFVKCSKNYDPDCLVYGYQFIK
jgi:hypothetical protein